MTGPRRRVLLALLMSGAGLLAAGSDQPRALASLPDGPSGGTFRISFMGTSFDYVDPALSYTAEGWVLLDATCPRLMGYPDKAPPEGYRLVPQVAVAYPRVSDDAKTFTFTLRRGFRFSNGMPVRASAFARAINRTLAPGVNSPGAQYTHDVVGAAAVRAGKGAAAAGVVASGNRLIVRFVRSTPDFPARTSMPFFCAVPPTLPSDPEGVGAFPGAGPYYLSEYVRGQRVVLERNRFYGGARPHHVDRFVVDLRADTPQEVLDRIERGQADWGLAPPPFYLDPARGLAAKYGVNRAQFFVKPGLSIRGFVLNTLQPLFRNNLPLRRAVNFALDRRTLLREAGGGSALSGNPTDQYLPPTLPGFKDARIYPLDRPGVSRARSLARGHVRGGKALLYTFDAPPALATAQLVRKNLKKIGLEVDVKGLPVGAFFRQMAAPKPRFDIAFLNFAADYIDPYSFTNLLFDGRFVGSTNYAHFDSPKYNHLMRRAALLQGSARYKAYGDVDVQLARDAVPMAAYGYDNELTLVSKRVGCIVLRPGLDLTTACLE